MPLNAHGRAAQAACLRRFLPAQGYLPEVAEEAARQVEAGDVEFDAGWLESIAGEATS